MKKRLLCHYLIGACLFMSCTCFFCNDVEKRGGDDYEEFDTLDFPATDSSIDIQIDGFMRMYGRDISYDDYNNPTYFILNETWFTASWVKTNPYILSIHVIENNTAQTRSSSFGLACENMNIIPMYVIINQLSKP